MPHPDRPAHRLQVSSYDRVASLLIALLIVVGFFVLLLFLIWLTQRAMAAAPAVPVELIEAGGAEGSLGTEKGFEEPDVEEVEDLVEPEFEETVDVITDAISQDLASLEAIESRIAGAGAGGDRDRGPGGGGNADVIPPWERWEILYSTSGQRAYADQLDFFGVELAAVGGGKTEIDYATNLSSPKPTLRSGSADDDRLYMVWRSGQLKQTDQALLTAAGVDVTGRMIVQFYPTEVEQTLARLELEHAGGLRVTEIRKTIFGVRRGGAKYEYYVDDQQFR
jgi:hypothetical protein